MGKSGKSEKLTAPRGMNDLLPPASAKWRHLESACRRLFDLHGYEEVRTPTVETSSLFARSVGEVTDIVEKQMYTFADRKGRSLSLRPENTASCVRAYIEHSIQKNEPVSRWFYMGPMFRYEAVQAGRYRQFYQIGVEAFGIAEPTMEVEQIAMVHRLFKDLRVPGLTVLINSVGDEADRPAYRQALLDYLRPHAESLSEDSQRRLDSNPLRILDSKDERDREIVADAPSVLNHLNEASRAHFDAVEQGLERLGVRYRVDSRLVRGLDYYTGTVFEIVSESGDLGAQSTVCAGGRYNSLVESLGGPATPAVGFAMGVERAVMCMPGSPSDYADKPVVFIVAHGDEARAKAHALATEMRLDVGMKVDVEHRSLSMKAQFNRADKSGARFAIVIGGNELESGQAILRDMRSREETAVPFDEVAARVVNQQHT